MQSAQQESDRADIPRMDIINNNGLRDCVSECQGTWMECAKEVLQMNNVPVAELGGAVCELLASGRGKNRNIFICGPPTVAKLALYTHFSKHSAALPMIDLPWQHVRRPMLFF